MTLNRSKLWTQVAAVAVLQTVALGWMVWDRVSLLKSGREITLDVVPVDPRDIFRGDFVILGYDITRVPADVLPKGLSYGSRVYVTLDREGDGAWKVKAASSDYKTPESNSQIVLAGRLMDDTGPVEGGGSWHTVRYGIESYFVPEGEGREIETQVREKKIKAIVAVGSSGQTALKGLIADGKMIHEQPAL